MMPHEGCRPVEKYKVYLWWTADNMTVADLLGKTISYPQQLEAQINTRMRHAPKPVEEYRECQGKERDSVADSPIDSAHALANRWKVKLASAALPELLPRSLIAVPHLRRYQSGKGGADMMSHEDKSGLSHKL